MVTWGAIVGGGSEIRNVNDKGDGSPRNEAEMTKFMTGWSFGSRFRWRRHFLRNLY